MMLEAERVLVEDDAGLAPTFFEGQVWLIDPSIKNFVDHRYGGGRDISFGDCKANGV